MMMTTRRDSRLTERDNCSYWTIGQETEKRKSKKRKLLVPLAGGKRSKACLRATTFNIFLFSIYLTCLPNLSSSFYRCIARSSCNIFFVGVGVFGLNTKTTSLRWWICYSCLKGDTSYA